MVVIQKIVLILHIISGFTALTSGLIPMFARKGGKVHIITGRIFSVGMYGVSVTAILMYILKPKPFLLFLLFIGVFSFYLTYTGVRAVKLKKANYIASIFDWMVLFLIGISGISMLVFAIWYIFHQEFVLGILYIVFSYFSLSMFIRDLKNYRKWLGTKPEKMAWFYSHMGRILGAYIATLTAFCVVNIKFLPPLVVWFLPGAIGAIVVIRWIRYYKKKFEVAVN